MKTPAALALILLASALRAQAPVPAPLARGNAPGEPHHHLKIENIYVRAYYVEVPPRGETQLHQHDNDYTFVTLGDSDVTNAVLGKPEVHLQLKDGEVRFTRGGFAHVARNNSDAPFRNVTIEFLRPQGNARNLCEKIIDGPLNDCKQSNSSSPLTAILQLISVKPLFDTEEVVATSYSLARSVNHTDNNPRFARLLVVSDKSELRVDLQGEPSKVLRSGDLLWLPTGSVPKITSLVEDRNSRFLLLSFKDSQTPSPN